MSLFPTQAVNVLGPDDEHGDILKNLVSSYSGLVGGVTATGSKITESFGTLCALLSFDKRFKKVTNSGKLSEQDGALYLCR